MNILLTNASPEQLATIVDILRDPAKGRHAQINDASNGITLITRTPAEDTALANDARQLAGFERHTFAGVTFDMLPWSDIKSAMRTATQSAKAMAKESYDFSTHRSNGFNFTGADTNDCTVYEAANCYDVPSIKSAFIRDVVRLLNHDADIAFIELDVTYDSADSPHEMHNGTYQAQTGYCTTAPVAFRVTDEG